MDFSLMIVILSYMGISVTNKYIFEYKYNIIFDKMIKKLIENGYVITDENKEDFIKFLSKNDKFHKMNSWFGEYDSKDGVNILSYFPGINLLHFLRNMEFMIDKKVFDYQCLSLMDSKIALEELEKNKIINRDYRKKSSLILKPNEDITKH